MEIKEFDVASLKKLYIPSKNSTGEDNGQVTIIGGSSLFHGAPLLSLKVASRIVDMVFFSSPEPTISDVANGIKSKLLSFVWIPWSEVEDYIAKSDAVLIGPGFMRFRSEKSPSSFRSKDCDEACKLTTSTTERLLKLFPNKRWVIDAGSLQTMETSWIPKGAVLTPNRKEFENLFKIEGEVDPGVICSKAREFGCTIVYKAPQTIIASEKEAVFVSGGNAGLTKGGTGDVLAGLTAALFSKNDSFLSAACASYILKAVADDIFEKVATNYNAEDLADQIPSLMGSCL